MAARDRPREAEEDEEGEDAAEAPVRTVPKKPVGVKERNAASEDDQAPPPPPGQPAASPETKAAPSRPLPPARVTRWPAPLQPPSTPGNKPEPEAPQPTATSGMNHFANDGSFMELFKKKMEQNVAGKAEEAQPGGEGGLEPEKRRPIGFVGKRRGGAKLALKTGIVAKKPKNDGDEVLSTRGGAWAQYMAEVKKYKAHQCSDDDKTRPLVK
uniref:Telomerase RNA component interacting RNase n=1 Tax=Leptobrachium leishanense TaxID=445787 RepID=A0A8C5WD61_9ANUR